ncbi:MAG: hypothetical protein WCB27_23835 [Thermoguttaceae bacterium]
MARRRRSHNKGYWFRANRGWYITDGKSAKPLCDEQGNHIKSADDKEGAKQAYARYLTETPKPPTHSSLTVTQACMAYLDSIRADHPETYRMRADLLFDFCTGFPAKYRDKKEKPSPKSRIHPGYLTTSGVVGPTVLGTAGRFHQYGPGRFHRWGQR